jgi:hypothetical protein
MRVTKVLAVIVAFLSLGGSAWGAEGGCRAVSGDFVAVALQPFTSECPSFFCTAGTLTGDLAGSYKFVAYGVTATGDLLGHSTITLRNGAVINGNDTSHLNGDGTFVTNVSFVGGTRQYAHVSGGLVAPGHFTATGGTEGTYSGVLCLGNEDDD